jgi:hypothetical protein
MILPRRLKSGSCFFSSGIQGSFDTWCLQEAPPAGFEEARVVADFIVFGEQVGDAESGFGDAVFGVTGVLRGDVNPFVSDDARDGFAHDDVAAAAVHAERQRRELLRDLGAIDVDEGLDLPVHAAHPAERAGRLRLREDGEVAITVQVDRNGQGDLETARNVFAAQQIGSGGELRIIGDLFLHRGGEPVPLIA